MDEFEAMQQEGRAITRFGLMQRLQDELANVEKQLFEIEDKRQGQRQVRRSDSATNLHPRRHLLNSDHGNQSQSVTSLPIYSSSKPSRKRRELNRAKKWEKKHIPSSAKRGNVRRGKSARTRSAPASDAHKSQNTPAKPNRTSKTPTTGHNGKTLPGAGNLGERPRTTPARRRRRSKDTSATLRPGSWSVAGYTQPGLDVGDESWLQKARDMSKDENSLKTFLLNPKQTEAFQRLGITLKELLPKPMSAFHTIKDGFKTRTLDSVLMAKRFEHFEKRRIEKLAAVMLKASRITDKDLKKFEGGYDVKKTVTSAILEEEQRQNQVELDRQRIANVLTKENRALQDRRLDFSKKRENDKAREARLKDRRMEEHRERQRRARVKQENIERVKKEREKREQMRIKRARDQMDMKEQRAQELRKKQCELAKQKNIQMREREAHRIAVRQDVNGGRERRIRELQHQMKQREAMIARAKAQKQRDRELRREDEMLRQQDRLEAVERMRRMADYKKMMTIKKIREDEERTRKLKLLDRAIRDERLKSRKREIMAKHKQRENVTIERELLPGPGEYNIKTTLNLFRGYKIGTENPKSDIEWKQLIASQIPGPGAYKDVSIKASSPTVKFSLADVPSDLELRMRKAPETPGPDAYNPRKYHPDTPAFSISNFKPKSEIEWIQYRARQTPGPCDYQKVNAEERQSLKSIIAKNLQ